MLDFHNHLIPGVDDGAASLEEALSGVAAMHAAGVRHVITTPHFKASAVRQIQVSEGLARIDAAWGVLTSAAKSQFPEMKFGRGVELALDEPIASLTESRLRLAGTRFALVEFPYFSIPPHSHQALAVLSKSGVTPIVAHPERYENLESDLRLLRAWKENGAYLQLNAGSLIGAYGQRVQRIAWRALKEGLMDYLCSDYHSRGKCLTDPAKRTLLERDGKLQFDLLAVVNGMRLLEDLDPTPVPPLRGRSKHKGIFDWFRRPR